MTVDPEEQKDLCTLFSHHLIHATAVNLEVHILLSLYDIAPSSAAIPSTRPHHTSQPHCHLCFFLIQSINAQKPDTKWSYAM